MVDELKRFLQTHHLPVEWLAIQTGLSKRTVLALLSGKQAMTQKHVLRFQRVLASKND